MNKKTLLTALAFAYLALLSLTASAQPGCCCDPIILSGTLVSSPSDCPSTFNFTRPPANLTETCTDVCKTLAPPQINVTLPGPIDCSSPNFKLAPAISPIIPVRGEKHLVLKFGVVCPAYSVNISRCAGTGCTDLRTIAQVSPTAAFTDTDPLLKWATTYRYQLTANYVTSGASQPAFAEGNPGDIECWHQGAGPFCISPFSYDGFESYLKTNGYAQTSPAVFSAGFSAGVNATFSSKFGKVWQCSDANLLFQNPSYIVNCAPGQHCVFDEQGPKCVPPAICERGPPFGLFSSTALCEGTQLAGKRYCFFDRSKTSVDACFACSPRMKCADYKSSGACGRDNCNAGQCEWRDLLPDIGIGVCVDKRFSNCPWCTKPSTEGLENNASFNEVFDKCTPEKTEALSVPGYPCVYNKNAQESVGCDAAACMDYTASACASPAEGIKLAPNNALASTSNDVCGIKVCQIMGIVGCTKNSDGNDIPDCLPTNPDRRKCEQDYFAPETSLVASTSVPGRMDWLDIMMLDKTNATSYGELMAGKPGYRLRVCVAGQGSDCSNPAVFAETTESRLNFNDLALQGGNKVLSELDAGQNVLKYYAIDASNNPEIIKEMTITACDLCQGPKIIKITVTPSKSIDGKFFTIANLPVITVSMNEPSTLQAPAIMQDGKSIPVAVSSPSGVQDEFTFIPVRELSDGTYTLIFNAQDKNGRTMDSPAAITITVDTTPGNVLIEPADGAILNATDISVSFTFDEPLTPRRAILEEEVWAGKYSMRKIVRDLLPTLATSDSLRYTTTATGLAGGKKNLLIEAEDFAGNPTIGKSSFWIDSGALQQRLREPSWGISPTSPFDIIVETSRPAECRYLFDTPIAPPATQFDFFAQFQQSTEGVRHTIPNFDKISAGDLNKHKLHVYCRRGDTNTSIETYELGIDTSAPIIKSAFAQPSVIIERAIPGANLFTTSLKVQTDDEGFCKYSTQNTPFVLMENYFPNFDEIPKKSHDAGINVTEENTTYTYYVACKNTAEVPSQTVPVQFSVDLSVPFKAASLTPRYSNSTTIVLRVETNKRAFCYYGEVPEAVINQLGSGEFSQAHVHDIAVNASGEYKWFVECSTGAGSEISSLEIPVTVDTTPPAMLYVNDSSSLSEEPEFSYFLNQLRVSFLGYDNETSINAYYYRILTFFANTTVLDWTQSTNTNGTAFFATGLNLTDGNKYSFEVYPVNIVGLQGASMISDGVTIDSEKAPLACENSFKDSDETDIDCGGACAGCLDGSACSANTDCASGFCNAGICAASACNDAAKNSNETDIDCGGNCLPCSINLTCVQHTDCASGNCAFGKCAEPDRCLDGVLTGTETDIDCGGSCATKCATGQNCQTTADCADSLLCIENTCQAERDTDNDGIKDDADACPNTPSDEVADETGCSLSQKFSCADSIPDGWRTRYFGSVLCGDNGAPDADPDQDRVLNSEEYLHGTDPTEPDSDFDGWNDRVEIDNGTNPLDPAMHPPSKLRILLWVLLVLLLIASLGVGGYLGYQYYLEHKPRQTAPARPPMPAPKKPRIWPDTIERLRRIARKEGPGITDRDWISLQDFSSRLKKEKVRLKPGVFERLQGLIKGELPRHEGLRVLEAVQKEPAAFALLRKITFEKLSQPEKAWVRKQYSRLREGKLSAEEREELFRRLRVTASYYRTHKEELEKELEGFLRRKTG